ncbi:hypothetical protein F2Q69_00042019 [Brassica cretica]|uniref:Uncharacterized protein n=1 Tax=Brassica cretica TaxID=69181 RepID=A0A8S9NHU6_BRACR|nr:hypothetical protein F2Q69_00042019 [Brassica cretica]
MDGRLLFLGGDGSFKHRYRRLKSGFFPAPFDIRLCFPLSHCLSFSSSDGSARLISDERRSVSKSVRSDVFPFAVTAAKCQRVKSAVASRNGDVAAMTCEG